MEEQSGFRQRFCEIKWGEFSLVSLYLSVVTGIIVALQYAVETPFFSSSGMDILVPFGSFWRSLHFYSSQGFFIFLLIHFLAVLLDQSYLRLSFAKWIPLVASIPFALLLLFSGYVLRADATGEMAGLIAENICLSVPVIGDILNDLFFAVSVEGMKRVYANHVIGFLVIWGVFCWDHVRKYRAHVREHGLLLCFFFMAALIVDAPMEPAVLSASHIPGPWFFLGLQELLMYIQPFWSGVVFPLSFLGGLLLLRNQGRLGKYAVLYSVCWLVLYVILTFIGLGR